MRVNESKEFIVGIMMIVFVIAVEASAVVRTSHDIQQALREEQSLSPDHAAPSFNLRSLDGKTYQLNHFRGTEMVLLFQTPPSHVDPRDPSIKWIAELRNAMKKRRDLRFLTVLSLEKKEDAKSITGGIVLLDPNREVHRRFRAFGIKAFLIDRNGRIRDSVYANQKKVSEFLTTEVRG